MSDGLTEGGELRSVEHAITIGSHLRHCWFRGHSRVVGALSPGAHREPFCSARENIEFWAGQRFRLRASAYTSDVPGWDDHVSWLFLAQHYGVPTRLLDWTENVLVGLYFAVTGGITSEDGEIWCMNHQELNWRSADWKDCFPDSPPVRYLAAAAFLKSDDLAEFKAALGSTTINGPLALIPPLQFPRMAAQMSRFTIHPSKEREAQDRVPPSRAFTGPIYRPGGTQAQSGSGTAGNWVLTREPISQSGFAGEVHQRRNRCTRL